VFVVPLVLLVCLLGGIGLVFGPRAVGWTLILLFASPFVLGGAGFIVHAIQPGDAAPQTAAAQPGPVVAPAPPLPPPDAQGCAENSGGLLRQFYNDTHATPCENLPHERVSPPPADIHAEALQQLLGQKLTPLN
jgi:hypothetical protein